MKEPVRVLWRDPVGWSAWATKDRIRDWANDEEDGGLNETVGWITFKTDDSVVFSSSRQIHGGNLGDNTKIPRSVIVEVRSISTGRKVKI